MTFTIPASQAIIHKVLNRGSCSLESLLGWLFKTNGAHAAVQLADELRRVLVEAYQLPSIWEDLAALRATQDYPDNVDQDIDTFKAHISHPENWLGLDAFYILGFLLDSAILIFQTYKTIETDTTPANVYYKLWTTASNGSNPAHITSVWFNGNNHYNHIAARSAFRVFRVLGFRV